MFKLQSQVSATIKIIAVLFLVGFIHILGNILGGLWIVSDLLLILGAYTAYNLVVDGDVRDELLENVKGDFDIDGIANWLISQVLYLVDAFGIDLSSLVKEEDDDVLVDLNDLDAE